jgi:hypothetical protein
MNYLNLKNVLFLLVLIFGYKIIESSFSQVQTKDKIAFASQAAQAAVADDIPISIPKSTQLKSQKIIYVDQLVADGSLNAPSKYGIIPINRAVQNGDRELLELLIQAGADINVKNSRGSTPIHIAVIRGYQELVELLLRAGADITIQDDAGFTALQIALEKGDESIINLLKNHLSQATDEVSKGGSDILRLKDQSWEQGYVDQLIANRQLNTRDRNGFTPIHNAILSRNLNLVKLLLKAGADITIADKGGITPLETARNLMKFYRNRNTIEILQVLWDYTDLL